MTPLSERYALPLALLLLVAALPVLAVEARPRLRDPCRHPAGLRLTGMIPGTQEAHGGMKPDSMQELLQWTEGTIPLGSRAEPLQFRLLRGYRERRLYMQPALLMDLSMEPERHEVLAVEAGPRTLPVHLVRDDTREPSRFAMYLFVYGTEPTEHPFFAQLAGVLQDLLHGSRPLTVMMVGGPDRRGGGPAQERARAWIADAWQHFDTFCNDAA